MAKTPPFFTQKELIKECARNATVRKMGSHAFYVGPHSSNAQMYAEYFRYFCVILQKALLDGQRVRLPGIGSIWLQVTKPRTYSNFGKGQVTGKPKLFLRAATAKKLETMLNTFTGENDES